MTLASIHIRHGQADSSRAMRWYVPATHVSPIVYRIPVPNDWDDLMPNPASVQEWIAWGQSMRGGDTSDMID